MITLNATFTTVGRICKQACSRQALRSAAALSIAGAVLSAPAAGFASNDKPTNSPTNNPPTVQKLQVNPVINAVSPTFGPGDTKVTITGLQLSSVTSVLFGNKPANFTVVNGNTLEAWAPLGGTPGSTVPVTALYNGNYVKTSALYSFPIGEMDVTGPLPFYMNGNSDSDWYNGAGHSISLTTPQKLLFPVAKPAFHVSVYFVDDSPDQPPPPVGSSLIGNEGSYSAQLQMCSLNGVPSFGQSDTGQACTDWDGKNTGTWVALSSKSVKLSSSGPGQTTSGDLLVDASAAFDQQNYARVFRLALNLQQLDTKTGVAATHRMDSKLSAPFTVVVTPAALVQLEVMPYTILYAPPGDASTVKFTTATAYGTNLTLSDSTTNSTTDVSTQSTSNAFSMVIGALAMNAGGTIDHTISQSFGTTKTGTAAQTSTTAFQTTMSLPANSALIPGNGDVCASTTDCSQVVHNPDIYDKEPFWGDMFILLVHPQFAMYVVGGGQNRYVMYGAVPVTADITVSDLALCAKGLKDGGLDPCELDYSDNGMTYGNGTDVVYPGTDQSTSLSAGEANHLLSLDPFYAGGQGATLSASRALQIANPNYGRKFSIQNTAPLVLEKVYANTDAQQQTNSGSLTSDSSMTTIDSTSESDGLSFQYTSYYKVSAILGNGLKDSYSTDIKTTNTDSTAVSGTQVTTADVVLSDIDDAYSGTNGPMCKSCHNPLPKVPHVNIYLDRMFGGFMFQDAEVPPLQQPIRLSPYQLVNISFNQASSREQNRQRFADVPSGSTCHLAVGYMARGHMMSGGRDGLFHPQDPLTRAQLATAIATPLHLSWTGERGTFADLDPATPVGRDALAAIQNGFISAESPSRFGADLPVSRQELAAALAREFHLRASQPVRITDAARIQSSAAPAIRAVVSAGVMKLDAAGNFNPTAAVSRCEGAQTFYSGWRHEVSGETPAQPVSGPGPNRPAQPTPPPTPQPAPPNSSVLVPDQAFPGGLLTGVVIGPDEKPVPNTPVETAGGVPAELTGEVVGEEPPPCDPATGNCQQPQTPEAGTTATASQPQPPDQPPADCRKILTNPSGAAGPAGTLASAPAGTGAPIVTDALGRFAICMPPNTPQITVDLPGHPPASVKSLTDPASLPTEPPSFFQPGDNIDLRGRVRDLKAEQGDHSWLLPAVRAWSPDGRQAITTFRIPRQLQPGPANISYVGDDGRPHQAQGSAFRVVRATIDRSQLHSLQGATFEYVVQFAPRSGQQLCVDMATAGPVVMVAPPAEVIPMNPDGIGTFSGRIRAVQVATGSVVPFVLTPHIHVCGK